MIEVVPTMYFEIKWLIDILIVYQYMYSALGNLFSFTVEQSSISASWLPQNLVGNQLVQLTSGPNFADL